jgi:hypothetical protein
MYHTGEESQRPHTLSLGALVIKPSVAVYLGDDTCSSDYGFVVYNKKQNLLHSRNDIKSQKHKQKIS